jgi:hypothetical protein
MEMNHIPQTSQFTCPCCRGFIGEAAPVEFIKDAVVGGLQVKIMSKLIDAKSRPVRMEDLIESCFADDPDGGPDDPSNSITVAIHKLRKRLEPFGWHIEKQGGGGRGFNGGAFYRLIPAEVTP